MNYDISAIMTKNPSWINGNASIKEAIDLLSVTKLSHLLIKENDALIGVVSKSDLMEKFYEITTTSSGIKYSNMVLSNTKIKSLVKKTPIYANRKSSCLEAIELMIKNKIHCIPVIDEENETIGILTPTDIMYAMYRDNL